MADVLIGGLINPKGPNMLTERGHRVFVEGIDEYDPESIEAVIVRCSPFTGGDMSRLPRLKVIARHGVGVDNIDLGEARRRRVVVANTPEANWRAVAEQTVADLLILRRRLISCDRAVRRGQFAYRNVSWRGELPGLKVGIVGYGRIGSAVSRMLSAGFGVSIVAYDPYRKIDDSWVSQVDSLEELLRASQVLSLHVPLTKVTEGMIGAAELAFLPAGALVINTARGEVIDSVALAEALVDGRIGGAAIDVFDEEPPSPGHPLLNAPNVILSPHKAGLTEEALTRMSAGAAEAIIDVLEGRNPDNPV